MAIFRKRNRPDVGKHRAVARTEITMVENLTRTRPATQGRVRTIGEVAAFFVGRVLQIERKYVSAGWWDPTGMSDAGFRVGLRVEHFGDVALGAIFHYLALCAEHGVDPEVVQCVKLGESWGIRLEPYGRARSKAKWSPRVEEERLRCDWLPNLIRETEFDSDQFDEYAADVIRMTGIRDRSASQHLAAIGRLMIDPDDYAFAIVPRQDKTDGTRRQHERSQETANVG